MSYISELRKSVGQATLINVGATIIVLNDRRKILLNLRTDMNTWGMIGESLEETAARELWGEAGLKAERFELLDVFSGTEKAAVSCISRWTVCRNWKAGRNM